MANQPGKHLPKKFRSGQVLTASDINKIVDEVIKRIVGGKGINIISSGSKLIVEDSDL